MTAVDDYTADPAVRQTATDTADAENERHNARARDASITDLLDALPDAESIRRWWLSFTDFVERVRSKEIWDIQPPSPRELVDRVLQGPWAHSGSPLLRRLAKTGMFLTLIWSVPLYTLAVLSQRFWRAIWTITLLVLIWNYL